MMSYSDDVICLNATIPFVVHLNVYIASLFHFLFSVPEEDPVGLKRCMKIKSYEILAHRGPSTLHSNIMKYKYHLIRVLNPCVWRYICSTL